MHSTLLRAKRHTSMYAFYVCMWTMGLTPRKVCTGLQLHILKNSTNTLRIVMTSNTKLVHIFGCTLLWLKSYRGLLLSKHKFQQYICLVYGFVKHTLDLHSTSCFWTVIRKARAALFVSLDLVSKRRPTSERETYGKGNI